MILDEQAQTQSGSHYDVHAFHDEILIGGALPLDLMDERVNTWIAAHAIKPAPPKEVY